ncbi:MAG TPA: right-handed parallel beta-helix repeat-containing protein [Atribacterota bacterium]|nr:right-handed parallel beta-helix repeat-containing protein [Atribacterota bacterium]
MKKLIYLIVVIVALGLIVTGCNNPVVPPTEQNETSGLTKGSIIYVDDDGGGPYTTIQAAIDASNPGDTIKVAAGIYSESNITIKKSLTILGAPGDSAPGPAAGAPVIDGGGVVADAFDLADGVSNVTISGFEIRNFAATDFTNGSGVGIQAWVPSTSNITVSDNWFHNVGYGVMAGNDGSSVKYALGTHTNWTVSGNIIEEFSSIGVELTDTSNSSVHGNVIHMAGGSTTGQIGIFSWVHISQSGLTVSGNTIDGAMVSYPAVYMYAYDDASPSPNLNDVTIENNTISTTGSPFQVYLRDISMGTVTGVNVNYNNLTGLNGLKNLTAVSVDATCNWWGYTSGPKNETTNPDGEGGYVSGNVIYSPWLLGPAPDAVCLDYYWYGFDQIVECMLSAKNHGQFVSCVSHLTKDWLKGELITAEDKAAITKWAAKSDIGKK